MTTNYIYYWDTCIFIAWLKEERVVRGLLDGIDEIKSKIDNKEATLVTSVITLTEIGQTFITDDKYSLFRGLFKRPNIIAYNIDEDIATLAGKLRKHYNNTNLHKLRTPDAIHLATAMILKANEINTTDGSGKKSGLLDYHGQVIDNYEFRILVPQPKQSTIFSIVEPKNE